MEEEDPASAAVAAVAAAATVPVALHIAVPLSRVMPIMKCGLPVPAPVRHIICLGCCNATRDLRACSLSTASSTSTSSSSSSSSSFLICLPAPTATALHILTSNASSLNDPCICWCPCPSPHIICCCCCCKGCILCTRATCCVSDDLLPKARPQTLQTNGRLPSCNTSL